MIHIHWTYVVFGIGLIFLLYQSFRDYGGGGDYDFSGIINILWIAVTIVWVAVWGGILWW